MPPFNGNFCAVGPDRQSAVVEDFGPPRPTYASEAEPVAPDENLQGTAKVEAQVDYENALAAYQQRRQDYVTAKRAYDEWHAAHRTFPVKITMPVVDAKQAVQADPERYRFYFPEPAASAAA